MSQHDIHHQDQNNEDSNHQPENFNHEEQDQEEDQQQSQENLDHPIQHNQQGQQEEDKNNLKGGQSISVISGGDQEEQEDYLKQNSIQYMDEHDQKNGPNTQRSQVQNEDQGQKNEENKIRSNSNYKQNQSDKKSNENDEVPLGAHVLNQQERELILKQNNHGKIVISGKKSSRESQNGQGSIMTPKKRLSIQRLSANKNQNGEEGVEKSHLQLNDANEFIKQQNSGDKNVNNDQQSAQEFIKLRQQNEKLREELKALSDKLSVVIEKNQKNINNKGRINNQSSDQVLKQELNNAYKLIDAIQKDNKKLQSQVYEGGHFEKVMKLENELKSKDQEVKIVKKELELTKKLQKITAAQEEDKKEVHKRNDDHNEKYALKQKIKELQTKLSDQDDKFNKQYREFLSMEKEYKKLCEKNNVKPNFVYNEQDNTFEKQKSSLNNLISRDRKSGNLNSNHPRRSESLRPLDRSRLGGNNNSSIDSNAALISQNQLVDPEFQNLEYNEANFYDLLQKARVYKKSKIVSEKKLNNEINELKTILSQKNQEIISLKQQLLTRDRQSNNLQSQLNQLKRQKQNLNEQQSYNQIQITDNNISIDENDNIDNNYFPGADQTNNSIQYATPIKQERVIPKKKLLPQTSTNKNKSKSPNPKSIVTQQDSLTSKKLISNPSTNIPYSNQNVNTFLFQSNNKSQNSPGKSGIKSARKPLPFSIGVNEQARGNNNPQYSSFEPNINSSRSPQQKKGNQSVQSSQNKPLISNQSGSSSNSKQQQQQQQQSNQRLSKKSNVNQSVEEFNSYSPTRFQNDEKNTPNQSNVLLQQSNMNKDDLINSQHGISPQQQILIPLTLRDAQIGIETEDSVRFTDRITLKQNYHHKIVYIKVIHDDQGIIGIQCNYRLQKTSQIIQGELHIIQNQNTNIIFNEELQVTDEFDVDEQEEGDYIKYVQGTINLDTNQIVNLIFATAKGYRKTLGLQKLQTEDNFSNFNLDISENEVPICLYGSLQKVYGGNENPIGSMLTQIGFNVERDDLVEENIKAFYTEDDQIRTEFESNQRQQELKKKVNNNSTKFIREDNPTTERLSQNGSQSHIQYISQENSLNNHNNNPSHKILEVPQSQQESPHFKSTDNKEAQATAINPIQIISQTEEIKQNNHSNHKENNHSNHKDDSIMSTPRENALTLSQKTTKNINKSNQSHVVQQKQEQNEFTLSNMRVNETDHLDKSPDTNKDQHLTHLQKNQSSLPPSRTSKHEVQGNTQVNETNNNYQIKVNESISRNSNSPNQLDIPQNINLNKLHTEQSNVEKNPSQLSQRSNLNQQNEHLLKDNSHENIQQNKSQQSKQESKQQGQTSQNQIENKNQVSNSLPQTHTKTTDHQQEHHQGQNIIQENKELKDLENNEPNDQEDNQKASIEDRSQQKTNKKTEDISS